MKINILISLILFFSSSLSNAQLAPLKEVEVDKIQNWEQFDRIMLEQTETEEHTGQGYMISGGLLLVGGLVGYSSVSSNVEKLAYSVVQSLGVAGIGYGTYLYNVGGEERAFYRTVKGTNDLSLNAKNNLFKSYKGVWEQRRKNEKMIRILSHSLVAAINFYNGARAESTDLKQGLYVIGGVNALFALSMFIEF
jgi:hypothetical protein